MKDVETVMRQLSNLYEFNRKLKTYRLNVPVAAKVRNAPETQDRKTPAPPIGPDVSDS